MSKDFAPRQRAASSTITGDAPEMMQRTDGT
jgi:hypothetical protein